MWNLKSDTNELTYKTEIDTYFEKKKVMVTKGEGLPCGSDDKASACNAGDPGLIPGSGRSPGEGNGNPLQYSCLKNFMDCRLRSLIGDSPWTRRVGHN